MPVDNIKLNRKEEIVMSKGIVAGIVAISLLVIVVVGSIMWYVGVNNDEVSLRNKANAQQKNLEVVFDDTWKICS